MADLVGKHDYQMDPKGRISLPAKYREAFEDGAFLTLGQEGCVYVFPREEWEQRAAEAKALPISGERNRAFTRMFFSNADVAQLDSQGRLVIPRGLREDARLRREVTVVGLVERLEIWDRQEWERYDESFRGSYVSGDLVPER